MKAYIAMSGGVDSSVSALLMKQAGHDITGVTLRLHELQGCGSANDAQEAAAVCEKLEIQNPSIHDGSPFCPCGGRSHAFMVQKTEG